MLFLYCVYADSFINYRFGFLKIKNKTEWNEQEDWYFSLVDVVGVLADTANPTDYLKKMRKRDVELGAFLGTNCPQVEMIGQNGLKRKVLAGNTKAVLRLIQSIPSKKAEHFKIWLAQVGSEKFDEIADSQKEPNQNSLDSFSFILLVSKVFALKPVLFLSFSPDR